MAANARMMRCCRRIWFAFTLLSIVFAFSCSLVCALEAGIAADDVANSASGTSDDKPEVPPIKKKEPPSGGNEDDWGSFYDPNNVFCGKFDCYKILGFDHETWGSNPPSLKDITKGYRGLSRKWHPDKNKAKGAREKFVAIAKAYEILTNKEKRAEYDHFRDRPDEYFIKYGSSVLWAYAPKSDASIIMIFFLMAASAFTYYAQKNKWQTIANHLVKAATEDLSPREGGSTESIEIREKALVILAEKKKKESEANETNGASNGQKKKKGPKMTGREKKEKEWEELRPICIELVNEIDDFGAGFRKPTMHDLLVLKMVKWPYYLTISILWWSKYAVRRLRKLELNDEERQVLTKNAVGEVTWVAVSDEERENMLTLELWTTDNLVEWRAEQEMKLAGLSANRRKQIKKMRKKGSAENLEEDLHLD
eukprot:CAMPEP_0172307900 /NCGR_PEP_ID=MMETSP1058-20130122/8661_1 /TAXON_ID=83371 /ORGANISM="Detonula confervacea, Strain CCMP 353" /LENGTH=423 /DNA_ID=CAMNT_0013020207 /DNA_START=61 /DNA_END=1332 /DNA_ORIENTATION=+